MRLSPPLAAFGDTLVSALAGLLGVVVGAVLAWWRERDQRRGATVSAARLVDAELADTAERISRTIQPRAGRAAAGLAAEFETPVWAEARAALALGLKPKQWGSVRDAFASVVGFRVALEQGAGAADVEDQGRAAMDRIYSAQVELAPLTQGRRRSRD